MSATIAIHPATAGNPQAVAALESATGLTAVVTGGAAELVRPGVVFLDVTDLVAFGDALHEAICRGAP